MKHQKKLTESWSHFYSYQLEARKLYPSIWMIPLTKKLRHVLAVVCKPGDKVLDVGANDRRFKDHLLQIHPDIQYKSMDIDPEGQHDYTSMDQIQETFDGVILSEVIEHLTFAKGVQLINDIGRVLKQGGYLIVTTPNVNHPYHFWNTPDHITPYYYDALAGLLLGMGFDIESLYRVHNQPFPQFYIRRYIGVWLHWYLSIDFAPTIIAVVRLRENDSNQR